MIKPTLLEKSLAWSVHIFTASGLLAGFMAILAVQAHNWRAAMFWLLACLVIDGIDGMAISSITFVAFTMALFLRAENDYILSLILLLLGTANLGVIYFNWPPAKVFIGDTGSSFNSYALSAII